MEVNMMQKLKKFKAKVKNSEKVVEDLEYSSKKEAAFHNPCLWDIQEITPEI